MVTIESNYNSFFYIGIYKITAIVVIPDAARSPRSRFLICKKSANFTLILNYIIREKKRIIINNIFMIIIPTVYP